MHAYVAEGEANYGGFVQVGSDRGLERQEMRQVSEHIRLDSSPPSGCFSADRPEEKGRMKTQVRMRNSSRKANQTSKH